MQYISHSHAFQPINYSVALCKVQCIFYIKQKAVIVQSYVFFLDIFIALVFQ